MKAEGFTVSLSRIESDVGIGMRMRPGHEGGGAGDFESFGQVVVGYR